MPQTHLHTNGRTSVTGGCAAGSNPGGTIQFDINDPADIDLDDVSIDNDDVSQEIDWSKKFDKEFEDVLQFMHTALAGNCETVRNTVREIKE